MILNDIQPAIQKIRDNLIVTDLRGHTYMSTYPIIMDLANREDIAQLQYFKLLSVVVYGWMPRVVRIDPEFSCEAAVAISYARDATVETYQDIEIQEISRCLKSVVGASKVLHFVNPTVFPIWDSKIQLFRSGTNAGMQNISNYLSYVSEVHNITESDGFADFYEQFNAVYSHRLRESGINEYQVGSIRAVEAAVFELAQ